MPLLVALPLHDKNYPKQYLQKKFGKTFLAVLEKFQPFLGFGQIDFYMIFSKLKKKSQNGKSGSVAPVKQGFLFLWPYG